MRHVVKPTPFTLGALPASLTDQCYPDCSTYRNPLPHSLSQSLRRLHLAINRGPLPAGVLPEGVERVSLDYDSPHPILLNALPYTYSIWTSTRHTSASP